MKKVLLLIAICFAMNTIAQVSFPDSAVVWTTATSCYIPPSSQNPAGSVYLCGATKYCATGIDTIIGSNTYSQVFICGEGYHGALRDDNGVVTYVPKDSTNAYTIYDFTAIVGDTIFNLYDRYAVLYDAVVASISIESFGGVNRKKMLFENETPSWIEGIGSEAGFLAEPYAWTNVSQYSTILNCMSVEDSTFYPDTSNVACDLNFGFDIGFEEIESEQLIVYPNPANDVIQLPLRLSELSFISIDGKVVFTVKNPDKIIHIEHLSSGMYYLYGIDTKGKAYSGKLVLE